MGSLVRSKFKTKLDKTVKVHIHLLYSFRRQLLFTQRERERERERERNNQYPHWYHNSSYISVQCQTVHQPCSCDETLPYQCHWPRPSQVHQGKVVKSRRDPAISSQPPLVVATKGYLTTLLPGDPKGRQNSHSPCSLNCMFLYDRTHSTRRHLSFPRRCPSCLLLVPRWTVG
jgi:hypothetical protein